MADAAVATPPLTGKAAKKAAKAAAKAGGEEKAGGGKKKIILILLVVVLAAVGFVVKTKVMAKPAGPVKPVPGTVLTTDAMYINLEGGHFLKLGLGLQETASAPKTTDAAEAQQDAIFLFQGRSIDELMDTKKLEALRQKLVAQVTEQSEGNIYDVYFTSFVMQ
mgnify:CR=1 FL=1